MGDRYERKMKEFELFKRIVSGYNGKIVENENEISITANNEIASYYENGEVHTKKVVECVLALRLYIGEDGMKRISFQGNEKTYSIIGGFGSPSFSEERLLRELKRYNFKPKLGQMNLFNLV